MNRTLTELAFKIVSLRFVYPPPPPFPPRRRLPTPTPPLQHFAIHYYFILPSPRDFEKYYHTAWYLLPFLIVSERYARGGNVKFPQNSESPFMYKPLQK